MRSADWRRSDYRRCTRPTAGRCGCAAAYRTCAAFETCHTRTAGARLVSPAELHHATAAAVGTNSVARGWLCQSISINLYLNQADAHKTAPDRIKLLHYTHKHKHTHRQTERKMVHIKQEHTHTNTKMSKHVNWQNDTLIIIIIFHFRQKSIAHTYVGKHSGRQLRQVFNNNIAATLYLIK